MKKGCALLLVLALLALPICMFAQSQDPGPDPWARVRFLVGEGKVDVTTKSGATVRGVIVRFEWNEIILRENKHKDQRLLREDVQEVRTVANRKPAVFFGIMGALAGGALGAAAGGGTAGLKEVPSREAGKYIGTGAGIGAALGAIVGGISGRNRSTPARVVYTAPPAAPVP